jgi:hypothetical protein
MDSLPYVSNDHHAPLISHTPLCSPGPHSVLRLVSCLRSWRVWVLRSIHSVGLLPPLYGASNPASSASRCVLETLTSTLLMTSDIKGGVWELAVERLSHGQSPLRIQRPPCPIHTPNSTTHGALAIPSPVSSSTLVERPLAASTGHVHRLPPPRISTTTGNCFPRTSTNTSAPAPSCMGSLASCTLQQLRGASSEA